MHESSPPSVARKYPAARALILLTLCTTLLSSCVVSGNDATPEPSASENEDQGSPTGESDPKNVIASTTTSSTESGPEFSIDIHSLARQGSDTLVLDMSMTNTDPESAVYIPLPPESGDSPSDYQHITLVDGKNKKKYLPLLYASGECYCKDWDDRKLHPGESIRAWLAFPPPPKEIRSLIFLTSVAPPIMDVPIDSSPGQSIDGPKSELADPEVIDLRSIEGDTQDDSTRIEKPNEVQISLSTDVLFDLNKSELNDSAEEKIRQVAREIEDSSSQTVRIDGYTDNTGNDAINTPLSKDRAQEVRGQLSNMLDEQDLTFETAGHGSSDPIATNETDEGRAKNRRVTITFQK